MMSTKGVLIFLILCIQICFKLVSSQQNFPVVLTTWNFESAAFKAWSSLLLKQSAIDAIVEGCSVCEIEQCDGSVGYGGSPDENGETALDAMIMDGVTMNVGAVVSMKRVKNAIRVARVILDHTGHSILSGERATDFAVQMGFNEESLTTNNSKAIWKQWKENECQPNFWQDVIPDPKQSCGPYTLPEVDQSKIGSRKKFNIGPNNHDTIGMVAIDINGNTAAGTSTNGATHKIPGRVADSAIPGSGAYAENNVGAAAATGDGDIMLRFSPSFLTVEEMRRGASPWEASETAVLRIASYYPSYSGAVIAIDKNGQYGAACHGMKEFPFVVGDSSSQNQIRIERVTCKNPSRIHTAENEVK